MDAQEQETITLVNVPRSSHTPQARCVSSLKTELEPATWPLQTVDDNATAAPRQNSTMKGHSKFSHDSAELNYQTTSATRHMPATYHPPFRSRRGIDDSGFPRGRKYEDEQLTYERRTQSYRDTTSEIISLYSSRNALGSNTSMARSEYGGIWTTDPPRYPSAQRHLQFPAAHGSHRNWQKTKSPAPYPTRLRRPGTSVTSPTTTEKRTMDHVRMLDYDRGIQTAAPNLYKASFANNQRRAPPLSIRAELNKSSSSLPSRSSPGPNRYRTATGRARTPSSTASWVSRPSDRYGMGSTDQSTRSASLTSIVEMYQRPMTASSTCPAIRPSGTLYYDYSEEFNKPSFESYSDVDVPLSPVPYRVASGIKPAVLRHQAHDKMYASLNDTAINTPVCKDAVSSTGNSFDSYLQGSHDDSIEEIERVIADAISNAAADKLMAASERLEAAANSGTIRCRQKETDAGQAEEALRGFYSMKNAPGSNASAATRRASQASLGSRNAMALDPSFADFTSLLSSFERLAKSPFSRLSDEDDMEERTSRRSSRLSAMETLDEGQAMEKPSYQKRHRRNVATARVSTPAPSLSESMSEQPVSSGEDTLVLAPEPLSPNRRQIKSKTGFDEKLMKALPPLPVDQMNQPTSPCGTKDGHGLQVRCKSLRSQLSRSNSPGKLRLRVRTPSSSGEKEMMIASCPTGGERRRAGQGRSTAVMRPPPRLKLKVSRNQLGHGQCIESGSVIRNNRLKQCNALADVAHPVRLDNCKRSDGRGEAGGSRQKTEERRSGEAGADERCSVGGSCQPSDQFNLSYPPTPEESAGGLLPSARSCNGSMDERQTVQSEVGDVLQRCVRPKFSFLRLGLGNQAGGGGTGTVSKTGACVSSQEGHGRVRGEKHHIGTRQNSQFVSRGNEMGGRSMSIKSERVGHRVKRWASDAKRAVRYYVRRTLVRSPKNAASVQV